MNQQLRHKRLRLLVSKVNKDRKRQAKKIDILCNEIIAVQKTFIKNLETISFTAGFYESIMGTMDMNILFRMADGFIKEKIADANIAFFLRQSESFELHIPDSDQPISLDDQRLENSFTAEMVNEICSANKICTLSDLLETGLQVSPAWLNKVRAATIPLGRFDNSAGFILVYRLSENGFTAGQLNYISAITPGLSSAIRSCRLVSQNTD